MEIHSETEVDEQVSKKTTQSLIEVLLYSTQRSLPTADTLNPLLSERNSRSTHGVSLLCVCWQSANKFAQKQLTTVAVSISTQGIGCTDMTVRSGAADYKTKLDGN